MKHLLQTLAVAGLCLTHISFLEATSTSQLTPYPAFCQQAAENEEVFSRFKSSLVYQIVLEHVSYQVGLEYLKIIEQEYPYLLSKIDEFRKNDAIGHPNVFYYNNIGRISPTTLRYMKVAGDLQRKFGDLSKMHIVEIGGGYGGQCKILSDLGGFASYTLIDLPPCISLAKKYLERQGVKNVSFIDNEHLEEAQRYDLVISNYAFAEIDHSEQQRYIDHIIKHTPQGYMIMDFISENSNFSSISMSALSSLLRSCNYADTIEEEAPCTNPDNLLLTWHGRRPN